MTETTGAAPPIADILARFFDRPGHQDRRFDAERTTAE